MEFKFKILDEIEKDHPADEDNKITIETNKFIKRVTNNLENFSYNKIIANIYQYYSFFSKELDKKYTKKTLRSNYEKILITISPVLPHFANECLEIAQTNKNKITWPKYDEKLTIDDKITLVVQINGRKRGLLICERDLNQDELFKKILEQESIYKYIKDKKINNKIFIPNKLINILI